MKNTLIATGVTLITIACSTVTDVNSITPINHNATVEDINIDKATKVNSIQFSTYFKKPETIILENRKDCTVKEIRCIEIHNNHIYILDDESNKLYVFNMDGTFDKTIGEYGKGHEEYLEISDFSIDRKLNVLYLWDEALDKAHKYKLPSGTYMSSITTERNGERTYCMLHFNNRLYLNRSCENTNIKYHIKEIDENNGNQTASYLGSEEYNLGWNYPLRITNSYFYCKNSKEPKYIEMFSDTIIAFTKKGLQPAYSIKSKDFVTRNDIEDIVTQANGNKRYDFSKLHQSTKIYQISSLAENKNTLIFKYTKGHSTNVIVYDRNKKEGITSEFFSNDYVAKDNTIPMDIMFCDNNYALSVLRPMYVKYFVDYYVSKEKINPAIDKYESLKLLNENSNPVLFLHEYK